MVYMDFFWKITWFLRIRCKSIASDVVFTKLKISNLWFEPSPNLRLMALGLPHDVYHSGGYSLGGPDAMFATRSLQRLG